MELFTQENTYKGALKFFKRKSIQLAIEGISLHSIGEFSNLGVLATYQKNGLRYQIFYLYKKLRGNGYYEKIAKKHNWTVLVSDSKYYDYFKIKNINYVPILGICKSPDYDMACDYLITSSRYKYNHLKNLPEGSKVKLKKSMTRESYIYNGIIKLDIRLLMLKGLGGAYKTMIAMCQDVYLDVHLDKYGLNGTIERIKRYRDIKRSFYLSEAHNNNEYITRPTNTEVKKMVGAFKVEDKLTKELLRRKDPPVYSSDRWMGILTVSRGFIKSQKKNLEYLTY